MKTFWKVAVFLLAVGIAGQAVYGLINPKIQSVVFRALVRNIPWAGYTHVIAGSTALVLGGIQLSSRLRRRNLQLHRRIGTAYVICVLIGSFAALIASAVSKTAWPATSGFIVLGILWPIATIAGYPRGTAFDPKRHGRFMIYSYAMTCAAISLRLILIGSMVAGLKFSVAYPISAWGGFLVNLTIVQTLFVVSDRRANLNTT